MISIGSNSRTLIYRTLLTFKTNSLLSVTSLSQRWKTSVIDKSKVPELDENDLEEQFVSGSGPGGQCVNKSINCCVLKHIPTGFVVKVHDDRRLEKNRRLARERMIMKLDNFYNGDDSVENQKRRIVLSKIATQEAQDSKRRHMKAEYIDKKRRGLL